MLAGQIVTAAQSSHDRGVVMNALVSQSGNYGLDSLTIDTGGSGYVAKEALIISSPSALLDAIIVVETVGGGGAILTYSISKRGAWAAAPAAGGLVISGGTGSGLAITPAFTSAANLTVLDIVGPQPNDQALVLQDELHSGDEWVWRFADFNGDGVFNWVPWSKNDTVPRDFQANPIQAAEIAASAVTEIQGGPVTFSKLSPAARDGMGKVETVDQVPADKVLTAKLIKLLAAGDKIDSFGVTTGTLATNCTQRRKIWRRLKRRLETRARTRIFCVSRTR